MNRLLLGALTFLGLGASLPALDAQPMPNGLGALVRELVVESLRHGGTRAGGLLVAADSASAAVLHLAAAPTESAPGPKALMCPASTEADGRPSPPPVGYVVQAVLTVATDSTTARLQVTKSCFFRYRGGGRRFGEGGTWELRREAGRWQVTASKDLWET